MITEWFIGHTYHHLLAHCNSNLAWFRAAVARFPHVSTLWPGPDGKICSPFSSPVFLNRHPNTFEIHRTVIELIPAFRKTFIDDAQLFSFVRFNTDVGHLQKCRYQINRKLLDFNIPSIVHHSLVSKQNSNLFKLDPRCKVRNEPRSRHT